MADPRIIVAKVLGIVLTGLVAAIVVASVLPKFQLKRRTRIVLFLVSLIAIMSFLIVERIHIPFKKENDFGKVFGLHL